MNSTQDYFMEELFKRLEERYEGREYVFIVDGPYSNQGTVTIFHDLDALVSFRYNFQHGCARFNFDAPFTAVYGWGNSMKTTMKQVMESVLTTIDDALAA